MTDEHNGGADIGLKIAGQELNLKNVKSLNTIATVTNLIVSCIVAYVIITHNAEARDGGKEVAAALKEANREIANALRESNKEQNAVLQEMVRTSREQNCLIGTGVANLPADRRQEAANLCKRISR